MPLSIPLDSLRLILTSLDFVDLLTAQQTCKLFQRLVQEEWLWEGLCCEVFGAMQLCSKDASWRAMFERLYHFETVWTGKDCAPHFFPYPMGWIPSTSNRATTHRTKTLMGRCFWWYFKACDGLQMFNSSITACRGSIVPGNPPQIQFTEDLIIEGWGVVLGGLYSAIHVGGCILGQKTYEGEGYSGSFFLVAEECTHDPSLVYSLLSKPLPAKGLQWHGTSTMEGSLYTSITLTVLGIHRDPAEEEEFCPYCCQAHPTIQLDKVTMELGETIVDFKNGCIGHQADQTIRLLKPLESHPSIPQCGTSLKVEGAYKIVAQVRGKFLFGTIGNMFTFAMKLRPIPDS